MRLSPEQRAELLALLRLRRALTDKALCVRYHINRRTLTRLRDEMLMAQNGLHEPGALCFHALMEECK